MKLSLILRIIKNNKKNKIETIHYFYWWVEFIHLLIINIKLSGFNPIYNLKQKYIILIPGYNLKIQKYNSPNLN